jgi:hypothetical protein
MFYEFLWAWGPWAYNKASNGMIRIQNIIYGLYKELTVKKEWVFIKNVQLPLNSELFKGFQNVEWRCQVNPPRFVNRESSEKERHLSYLGFVIKIDGNNLDLSDWINDVLYTGKEEPSVEQIFILWCCEQGVSYFHCLDIIEVEYITELGDTVRRRV